MIRTATRWALAGALVVTALAVVLVGARVPRANADGFLVGCPAGSDTELGTIHFVAFQITPANPNLPPTVIVLNLPQLASALGTPAARNLDADADGTPDLQWNLELGAIDLSATNLEPLWDRVGSALDASNPYTAVRVSFDRLATDLSVAPFRINGGALFDLVNGGNPTTTAVNLGYDTSPTGAAPPTHLDMTVVFQDAPPAAPDSGYLGARISSQYRTGGDPAAALVTPGSEPPLNTFVKVGNFNVVDEDLDLSIDWARMPAQFAFVDATTCTGPAPNRTFAWDDRDEQPGVADDTVAPSDADVELTIGKAKGVAGRPELHLAGTVHAVPEEMTARLTETNIRLFHQQHPDGNGNSAPSSPAPDLDVGELVVTALSSGPGDADTRLAVSGFVTDLPPVTNVDVLRDATGAFQEADVRFCDGAWASNECNDTLGTVGEIGLVASNVLPGETTSLPTFPLQDGPIVAYANRDIGGQLSLTQEQRFRFATRMPGVRHVHFGPPVVNTTSSAFAEFQLASSVPSAKVVFDSDMRHYDLDANLQALVKGARFVLNGRLTPVPEHATFGYTSTNAVPFSASYQLFGAQGIFDASFAYEGNTANSLLRVAGRGLLGDAAAGMPAKATMTYTAAPTATGLSRLDYTASSKTRLRAGFVTSTSADRAKQRRTRVWGDVTLGARLVAEWQRTDASLRHFELRPCDVAPCTAGTVFDAVSARAVYGPPVLGEAIGILSAPALPAVQPAATYPAFTSTPFGITYVQNGTDDWGARVELSKVKRVRYDYPSLTTGRKVCAETSALPKTVTDKRFGTRVFVSGLVDRKGLPIDPIYVDGILNQLPTVLDARVNDEGSANNPLSIPLLWIDTRRCDGTTQPTGSAIEASSFEYRVLAKIGATAAHQTMDIDPLGKASIGLGKPTGATPLGATVHVLSDGTADVTGVDVAARLPIPTQLVAYRPNLDVCDDSTPPNEINACQSQQMFTRDARTFVSMKILSTISEYGAADVLMRIRGHHTTDDPDSPATPNECLVGPGGKKVCDLDIAGHVDHVPGMVQVLASFVTNRRAPNLDARFEIDTLGSNPALFPTIGAVHATVLDDASPAYVGAGSSKTRTNNDDVSLTGVEHAIHAELVYQGNESMPSHHNVCPDHNYVGRGSMGVEYIHAEVDVGVATSVAARARVDVFGRLEAELMTDQPVNGTVYAKAKNVGFGYKDEILTVFDTSDIDLCIDVDLPFRMTLQNTTVARLGVDQTAWALQTASSSQKITLRFGERQADGSFLSGARWFKHIADYDPEGPGDWTYSQTGRRTVWLMPLPYWNGTEILNNFDDEWALANQINTGKMFGNDDAPTCCVAGNKTTFLLDLFWNQTIRDDMYCRDRPACVPDFAGRPGFEFHKAIWQRGHLPPTGNLVMGALSNPNPAPATTGSFSLTTSGTDNTMDVETSKYAFATGTVVTGLDGTRYRIAFGPSNRTRATNRRAWSCRSPATTPTVLRAGGGR